MKCLALRVAGRKSGDGSGGAGCSLERSLGGRGDGTSLCGTSSKVSRMRGSESTVRRSPSWRASAAGTRETHSCPSCPSGGPLAQVRPLRPLSPQRPALAFQRVSGPCGHQTLNTGALGGLKAAKVSN